MLIWLTLVNAAKCIGLIWDESLRLGLAERTIWG